MARRVSGGNIITAAIANAAGVDIGIGMAKKKKGGKRVHVKGTTVKKHHRKEHTRRKPRR